ncbi:hypothetical protein [Zhongshania sp.]|uniref:hypothetical protein n=1 Tax=Zhongshania sp. TaxID=1971902 RepID=UPI0035691AF9
MRITTSPNTARIASLLLACGVISTAHGQALDPNKSPALCGDQDLPEAGIQGDVNTATVNCGLTLLSKIDFGGSAQGSGYCAYVRVPGSMPYTGSALYAYSLADPLKPVKTGEEPSIGGSESIRAKTVGDRAVLVAGNGVYEIGETGKGDCKLEKKGEIDWPSANSDLGLYVAATSSHEIAISHDAKRVYSGLGFVVADISNLDLSETWSVRNWTCEMNAQTMFVAGGQPPLCEQVAGPDYPRQYSHSSDDNLEGTLWYGANQAGDSLPELIDTQNELVHQLGDIGIQQAEPPTARIVDISNSLGQKASPPSIEIKDTLVYFPGHSMNWWRTKDGREFIVGANENVGQPVDSCQSYPRPTSLGNSLEAYIAEVTGGVFDKTKYESYRANPQLTLAINRPENCEAATASGTTPKITEYSLYNENGAAMLMVEYGSGGLRIFDLRDGDKPIEVAYFNDGNGHVHSGVFHYNDKSGIIYTSGSQAVNVLELQPQVIAALGLPYPTDPEYPRSSASGETPKPNPGTGTGSTAKRSSGGGSTSIGAGLFLLMALLARNFGARRKQCKHTR